ncbi:response regulator [Paremcibacter congregatus]|uniref:Response regulator n=1 Tax=Paremcibacter congregatus TaxID=2043170 RepID=A0A2G4YM62_9PROT|nr:response regulator [Paremcibacter congregatus]QDE29284.1 response regulator [Paremcibacter congregatus]
MPRILLAEDDDTMRVFLARSLEKAGYQVVSVGLGTDGLPLLAGGGFDLLLTDIVMPGMDGIELARRATKIQPKLHVMFITGFAAVAMDKAQDRPANSKVLQKPFHLKDLVDEVDRLFCEVI